MKGNLFRIFWEITIGSQYNCLTHRSYDTSFLDGFRWLMPLYISTMRVSKFFSYIVIVPFCSRGFQKRTHGHHIIFLTLFCGSCFITLFAALLKKSQISRKWENFDITTELKSSWDFCSPRNILTLLKALTFLLILVHISLMCVSNFNFLSILTPLSILQ